MSRKQELLDQAAQLGLEHPKKVTIAELDNLIAAHSGAATTTDVPGSAPDPPVGGRNPDPGLSIPDPGPRPTWDAGETRQQYHARVIEWKRAVRRARNGR